jgi:hypothetical protein
MERNIDENMDDCTAIKAYTSNALQEYPNMP